MNSEKEIETRLRICSEILTETTGHPGEYTRAQIVGTEMGAGR